MEDPLVTDPNHDGPHFRGASKESSSLDRPSLPKPAEVKKEAQFSMTHIESQSSYRPTAENQSFASEIESTREGVQFSFQDDNFLGDRNEPEDDSLDRKTSYNQFQPLLTPNSAVPPKKSSFVHSSMLTFDDRRATLDRPRKGQDFQSGFQRRQKRARRIKIAAVCMIAMEFLLITAFFWLYSSEFLLGQTMAIVITLINACLFMIWVNIKQSLVRPQVDSGIRVWWMCCLRLAESSAYRKAENKKKAHYMKRQTELSMAKGLKKIEAKRRKISELKKIAKDSLTQNSLASDLSESQALKEAAEASKHQNSIKQRQQNMFQAWMSHVNQNPQMTVEELHQMKIREHLRVSFRERLDSDREIKQLFGADYWRAFSANVPSNSVISNSQQGEVPMSSVFVSLNQSITDEDRRQLLHPAARLDQNEMIMVIEEDEGNFSLPDQKNTSHSLSQGLHSIPDRTVKVSKNEDSSSGARSSRWKKLQPQIMDTNRATHGSGMTSLKRRNTVEPGAEGNRHPSRLIRFWRASEYWRTFSFIPNGCKACWCGLFYFIMLSYMLLSISFVLDKDDQGSIVRIPADCAEARLDQDVIDPDEREEFTYCSLVNFNFCQSHDSKFDPNINEELDLKHFNFDDPGSMDPKPLIYEFMKIKTESGDHFTQFFKNTPKELANKLSICEWLYVGREQVNLTQTQIALDISQFFYRNVLLGFYNNFAAVIVDCTDEPDNNPDPDNPLEMEIFELYKQSYTACQDFVYKKDPSLLESKKPLTAVTMLGFREFNCSKRGWINFICDIYPYYPQWMILRIYECLNTPLKDFKMYSTTDAAVTKSLEGDYLRRLHTILNSADEGIEPAPSVNLCTLQ